MILIASKSAQLKRYVTREALQSAVASGFWPGPVTLLLAASRRCPVWLKGRHATLAVRVTAHRPTIQLCNTLGTALVSTSANRRGRPAIKQKQRVQRAFGQQVKVMRGHIGKAKRPSIIRDLVTGQILRH